MERDGEKGEERCGERKKERESISGPDSRTGEEGRCWKDAMGKLSHV